LVCPISYPLPPDAWPSRNRHASDRNSIIRLRRNLLVKGGSSTTPTLALSKCWPETNTTSYWTDTLKVFLRVTLQILSPEEQERLVVGGGLEATDQHALLTDFGHLSRSSLCLGTHRFRDLVPRDPRRTFARLCQLARGELCSPSEAR